MNDEIIYIGKSDSKLPERIHQHGKNGDNISYEGWSEIHKSDVFYINCINSIMSDVIESELIRRYRPKYNRAKTSEWDGLPFTEPEWNVYNDNEFVKNKSANSDYPYRGIKRLRSKEVFEAASENWKNRKAITKVIGLLEAGKYKIIPVEDEQEKRFWKHELIIPLDMEKDNDVWPSLKVWLKSIGGDFKGINFPFREIRSFNPPSLSISSHKKQIELLKELNDALVDIDNMEKYALQCFNSNSIQLRELMRREPFWTAEENNTLKKENTKVSKRT